MKKIRKILTLCLAAIIVLLVNIGVFAEKNDIFDIQEDTYYENRMNIDLKDITLNVENGKIVAERSKSSTYSRNYSESELNKLNYILESNENYKNDLITLIESGEKVRAIGLTEVWYRFDVDKNNNVVNEYRLTEEQVIQKEQGIQTRGVIGDIVYSIDGRLQLYTTVSGGGPFWAQSNAYWTYNSPLDIVAAGLVDAIGLTWENNFISSGGTSTILYQNSTNGINGSQSDIEPYGGVVHKFYTMNIDSIVTGAYLGATVEQISADDGIHWFASEYIHTLCDLNVEFSLTSKIGNTSATITMSPNNNSYYQKVESAVYFR